MCGWKLCYYIDLGLYTFFKAIFQVIYYLDLELGTFLEATLQAISYSFFIWIRRSRVTLDPVSDKMEDSVGILDSKNISVNSDGSN